MSPEVLRRKLHRKIKRKKYANCSRCGQRAGMDWIRGRQDRLEKRCGACGLVVLYGWSAELGRVAELADASTGP